MNRGKMKIALFAVALLASACVSAATVNIAANGGEIPNSPDDAIVINSAGEGSGGITLGATSVTVSNITQSSTTAATVHINSGETLTANYGVFLASGRGDLSFVGDGVIKGGDTSAPSGGYGLAYLQNNTTRKRLNVSNRNNDRTLTIGVMPDLFDAGDDGVYIYRHRGTLAGEGGTGPIVFQVDEDWTNAVFFALRNGTNYVRGTGWLTEGITNRSAAASSAPTRETVSAETQLSGCRPVLVYDGCKVKGGSYSCMSVGDNAGTGTVIFRNGAKYDNGSPTGDATHAIGIIKLGTTQNTSPTDTKDKRSLGTIIVEGEETDVRCCFMLGDYRGNGVLVQKGGTLRPYHSYSTPVVGCNSGYGYLELAAGSLLANNYIRVGSGDSDYTDHSFQSTGLIVQKGGMFQCPNLMLGVGKNSHAWFVQRGGTFTSSGSRLSGEGYSKTGIYSGFIVDGEGETVKPVATFSTHVNIGTSTNGVTHVVVKNGGAIKAYTIRKDPDAKAANNGAKTYVSIDGGTVRAGTSVSETGVGFFGDADKPHTSVTVYSGGLTFDTDGQYANLRTPLVGPSGSGIASIEIPDELKAANKFMGAPLVIIEGDGEGASAYCDWDYDTKTLNGIRIASPGYNYTTATAKLVRGGMHPWTNETLSCVLTGTQTGGGLVKTGTGSLRLFAANSFHGDVVVSNGTIDVNSPDVIPATAAVHVMTDAQLYMPTSVRSLDFNGRLGSGGGLVAGNIKNVRGWTVRAEDVGQTLTISGTLSFAGGADFTIDHPERLRDLPAAEYTLVTANNGISGDLPAVNEAVSGWRLVQSGNSIKMKPSLGMMLIIR